MIDVSDGRGSRDVVRAPGSRIHSYPAEQNVPDQDASCEVTFQEARAHLGVETQRQWSNTAIARTTPCLLALFSIVTLLAARLSARQRRRVEAAAWYPKPRPTFADALAAVRCAIWRERTLATSPRRRARTKPRFRLPPPWAYALCHAA